MTEEILLNKYKLGKILGKGSTGRVYRAQVLDSEQTVAVKKIHCPSTGAEESLFRFRREVQILSDISHPNIIQLIDWGLDGSELILVMEFLEGKTLAKLIQADPIPATLTLKFLLQIVEALDHVHGKQLLHQDLRPSNIWLVGEEQTVKVLDFGLSKLFTNYGKSTTIVLDSYAYMPPEQSGMLWRSIDHRSDFYALGVIAYEMLTGKRPFESEDMKTLLHQHTAKAPPQMSTWIPSLPTLLQSIVFKLLEKDPSDRYQSTSGLMFDLLELLKRLEKGEQNPVFELFSQDFEKDICFEVSRVGREEELQQIREIWERTQKNQKTHLVLISGESGIGKSMLLEVPALELKNQQAYVLSAKNSSQETIIPYHILTQILGDLLQQKNQLSEENQKQLTGIFRKVLKKQHGPLVRLFPEFQIWQSEIDAPSYTPQQEQTILFDRLKLLFKKLSTLQNGLVIILDNLQWADTPSLQFFSEFLEAEMKAPILLLASYREGDLRKELNQFLTTAFSLHKKLYHVRLGAFPEAFLPQLIGRVFVGGLHQEEILLPKLYESSSGNPSMILNLLKALEKSGAIAAVKQKWHVIEEKLKAFQFPKDNTQIVMEQIGELSEQARLLMSCAAIIGQEFHYSALSALGENLSVVSSQEQCFSLINEVVQAGLIRKQPYPRTGYYSFASERIVAILNSKNKESSATLGHGYYAQWLETQKLGSVDELAYHYNLSNDHEKAVEYNQMAAENAKRVCSNWSSTRYFHQALQHLEELPTKPKKQQLYIELAHQLLSVGIYAAGGKEILPILKKAASLAKKSDAPQSMVHLHNDMGRFHYLNGNQKESLKYFRKGLEMAKKIGDKKLEMQLINAIGRAMGFKGEYIAGIKMLKKGIRLAEKHKAWDEVAYALGITGLFYQALGNFEEAIHAGEKSIDLALKKADLSRITSCQSLYAWTLAIWGKNVDQTIAASYKGIQYAQKNKTAFHEFMCLLMLMRSHSIAGDMDKAEYELNQIIQLREKTPVVAIIDGLYYCFRSEFYLLNYQIKKAYQEACRAIEVSQSLFYDAYALRLKAQILGYQLDKKEEAEALFEESIRIAESIHAQLLVNTARWQYGLFKLQHGQWLEGAGLINQAEQELRSLKLEHWSLILKRWYQQGLDISKAHLLEGGKENMGYLFSVSKTLPASASQMLYRRQMDTIVSTTRSITEELELKPLMEVILDALITTLGAEEGMLALYEKPEGSDEKKLVLKTARQSENTPSEADHRCMWTIANRSIETRLPVKMSNAQTELSSIDAELTKGHGLKSVLCFPLIYKEILLGIVLVHNRKIIDLFSEEYVELMGILAGQSAVAIQNAKLLKELTEAKGGLEQLNLGLEEKVNERTKELNEVLQQVAKQNAQMKEDLVMAEEVQKRIFSTFADYPFVKIALRYIPLTHVSGDIYHISPSEKGKLNLFVGDATGHGVAAALTTIMVNTALLEKAKEPSIKNTMRHLNQVLEEHLPVGRFMSGIYVRVASDGFLEICAAGHPPLIIVPADGSDLVVLKNRSLLLGIFTDERAFLDEKEYTLQDGDKVFLYTDGLMEVANSSQQKFGESGLTSLLAQHRSLDLNTILSKLLDQVTEFAQEDPLIDDITIVAFQYVSPGA